MVIPNPPAAFSPLTITNSIFSFCKISGTFLFRGHTLTLYNDEPDIALQIGQEQYIRVRNNTAATIGNGTAVLINDAHGNAAPTISGAIASSEANSQAIGLATHSIEAGSFGYVTMYGIVRDIDTSEFSAGDEVFLSATQIGSGVG